MEDEDYEFFQYVLKVALEDLVQTRPKKPIIYLAKAMLRHLPGGQIEEIEELAEETEDGFTANQSQSSPMHSKSPRAND